MYRFRSGDGARAHELSMEGKTHAKKQDDIDEEAANWIYYGEVAPLDPSTDNIAVLRPPVLSPTIGDLY